MKIMMFLSYSVSFFFRTHCTTTSRTRKCKENETELGFNNSVDKSF